MRKRIVAWILFFVVVVLPPFGYASAAPPSAEEEKSLVFPASLRLIEEEAFAGSSAETLVFPNGFLLLGEEAFSDAPNLRDVYLPPSTVYIGRSAFPTDQNELVIHGVEGSYAQIWAASQKLPFVSDNIWSARVESIRVRDAHADRVDPLFRTADQTRNCMIRRIDGDEGISMRPQDRPELNPIDYRFP